jgi:hypothetical protein
MRSVTASVLKTLNRCLKLTAKAKPKVKTKVQLISARWLLQSHRKLCTTLSLRIGTTTMQLLMCESPTLSGLVSEVSIFIQVSLTCSSALTDSTALIISYDVHCRAARHHLSSSGCTRD